MGNHKGNTHGTKLYEFDAKKNLLVLKCGHKTNISMESRHSAIELCIISKDIAESDAMLKVDYIVDHFKGGPSPRYHSVLLFF